MKIDKYSLAIYLLVSALILIIRVAQFNKPIDCEWRYLDLLFPLSRIACPIGGGK